MNCVALPHERIDLRPELAMFLPPLLSLLPITGFATGEDRIPVQSNFSAWYVPQEALGTLLRHQMGSSFKSLCISPIPWSQYSTVTQSPRVVARRPRYNILSGTKGSTHAMNSFRISNVNRNCFTGNVWTPPISNSESLSPVAISMYRSVLRAAIALKT